MPYMFARQYAYRLNNIKEVDADAVGKRLAQLRDKKKGRIQANDVVDECRSRTHPGHRMFEWDDSECGRLYREEQARELLEIVRFTDGKADSEPRRLFLNLIDPKDKERSYRSVEDVMSSRDLQLQVLRAAERDLRLFESRYQELLDICALVRAARERISEARKTAEEAHAQ